MRRQPPVAAIVPLSAVSFDVATGWRIRSGMQHGVAIVTGAGRGIGRATAIRLAARGYFVVAAARTRAEIEQTVSLAGGSRHARGHVVDVTDSRGVSDMVGMTVDAQGQLDVVVNNAGVAPVLSVEQTTDEAWRQVIETNLSSAMYLTRAAWPYLKVRGGVIVNVSSRASQDPFPGFAAYGAAKAAINLYTLAVAREGAAHQIRCHAVAPGAVETGMFRQLMNPDEYPPDKTLSPDDVAAVIVSCVCGDLVHTSGQTITLQKTL